MYYFVARKSSSEKDYYNNPITGENQWGFNTYFKTQKKLPRGWIRLNYNGENVYKFNGNRNKKVSTSSYYAPTEKKIVEMSYQDLVEKEEQKEACRRQILFENVARRLKLTTDSICDESLQYLADKAKVSVEEIIAYIEQKERKQLGTEAELTFFNTIKQKGEFFLTERSIRELCGVNIREAEASKAMNQIDEELSCPISRDIFKDPVTCSSGHTFERDSLKTWFQKFGNTCPKTRVVITDYIVPNHALRTVLEKFIEKYENQKGDIWKSIVASCLEYKNYFTERLTDPEHLVVLDEDPEEEVENLEQADLYETGRTAAEIRAYMIMQDNSLQNIDNIPDVIAASEDSSYGAANDESYRRHNNPEYLELHMSRTADEILEYMSNRLSPDSINELLGEIPEIIASNPDNSYSSADRMIEIIEKLHQTP